MAKAERKHLGGLGRRSKRVRRVGPLRYSSALTCWSPVDFNVTACTNHFLCTGTKREDFSVPFSLSDVVDVSSFVAREAELTEIHARLGGDGSRRTVVLHGLGGIGKTQLITAYAKRHKENYSAIFWLNIKVEDALKQSFSKIARQISRAHPSASWLGSENTYHDLDKVVDAVKAWLSLPDNLDIHPGSTRHYSAMGNVGNTWQRRRGSSISQ